MDAADLFSGESLHIAGYSIKNGGRPAPQIARGTVRVKFPVVIRDFPAAVKAYDDIYIPVQQEFHLFPVQDCPVGKDINAEPIAAAPYVIHNSRDQPELQERLAARQAHGSYGCRIASCEFAYPGIHIRGEQIHRPGHGIKTQGPCFFTIERFTLAITAVKIAAVGDIYVKAGRQDGQPPFKLNDADVFGLAAHRLWCCRQDDTFVEGDLKWSRRPDRLF